MKGCAVMAREVLKLFEGHCVVNDCPKSFSVTYVYGLHRGDVFMVTEEEWYKELTPENIPSIEAFEHWLDVIEKGEE